MELPLDKPPKCEHGKHDYHETEASKRSFEGETYVCRKCGDSYYLDYEDMK